MVFTLVFAVCGRGVLEARHCSTYLHDVVHFAVSDVLQIIYLCEGPQDPTYHTFQVQKKLRPIEKW